MYPTREREYEIARCGCARASCHGAGRGFITKLPRTPSTVHRPEAKPPKSQSKLFPLYRHIV